MIILIFKPIDLLTGASILTDMLLGWEFLREFFNSYFYLVILILLSSQKLNETMSLFVSADNLCLSLDWSPEHEKRYNLER